MLENKQLIIGAASLIAAATGGGAIGYLVAKKQLTAQYEELASLEIAQAREFFAAQYKTDKYDQPSKVTENLDIPVETVAEAKSAMSSYQGQKVNIVTPETDISKPSVLGAVEEEVEEPEDAPTVVVNNVFVNGEPLDPEDFDMEVELEYRKNNVTYVVTEDEYTSNDEHYETTTLTYFESDRILIDDDEKPIDDVEQTVGVENLKRFGHGAGDVDIVFIANDARQMMYEVLRSYGSYREEVMGLEPEDHLKHSDDYHMRRRRREMFDE